MRRYTAILSHLTSLTLCLFLGLSNSHADEISFVLNGSPIPGISVDPLNGYTVFDNESYSAGGNPLSPTNFNDLTNRNVISAWIDMEEPTFQPDAYRYDIILFVEFLDGSGNSQKIGYDTLSLTFDPNANTTFDDRAFLTLENGYYTTAKILDIIEYDAAGALTHIQTAPDWIMFDMRIEVERYYDFNRQLSPDINVVSSNNGMIEVSWSYSGAPASIPESYDLEWTFVDDYGVSSMEYDFSEYAVRVNVPASQLSYQLENVFTSGFLIFRVRAVGRISSNITQRQEGIWSSPPDESGTISVGPQPAYVFKTTGHEEAINWRYQVTYIEEGKHKGVISYHDGSLRGRQTVTRLSEEGVAMIAETVYDFEGRPSIQFLPTPNFYDTGSTPSWDFDEEIKYYDGVNLASSNNPYSWNDFEVEQMNAICDPVTVAADNSSGAARYYSSSNPMATNQAAHIPNAGGYPFVQTEYTADNTGRIRKQGGVGPDHQIDGEHASTYFYTVPSQEVLNALFGTNVGYAQHYRKTVVLDPNGQASVTYLDPYGRTIATSLAGDVPDNVTELVNYADATDLTIDLATKSNQRDGNSIVGTYNHHVLKKADHTFTYKLDAATFESNCPGVAFCYDCVYEFEFLIQDNECGDIIASYSELLGPAGALDDVCNASQYVANIPVVELDPGEYLITKKLTVEQASLDAYAEMYFEDNTCLKTEEDFYQEFLAEVDFSMCDDDACSYDCKLTYGRNSQEFADLGYSGSYEDSIAACYAECNRPQTICEMWETYLMQEVSPGGRYAEYTLDANQVDFVGSSANLPSVLDLMQNQNYKTTGIAYTPADVEINGQMILVENLTVTQLIENWQPSWARNLIKYHPDHCLYIEACTSNGAAFLEDGHEFDTDLLLISTALDAANAGYIDLNEDLTTSITSDLLLDNQTSPTDPFFGSHPSSSVPPHFYGTTVPNYKGSGYSMLEVATVLAFCPDANSSSTPTIATCLATHSQPFADECTRDQVWLLLRSLYLSEKTILINEAIDDIIASNPSCPVPSFPISVSQAFNQIGDGVGGLTYDQAMGAFTNATPPYSAPAAITAQMVTECQETCESYRFYWESKLVAPECSLSQNDIIAILDIFEEICACSCADYSQPLGASDVPINNSCTITNGYTSFEEVLADYGVIVDPTATGFDADCEASQLSWPPTMEQTLSGSSSEPSLGFDNLDECACDLILQSRLDYQFAFSSIPQTFEEFFAAEHGFEFADLDALACDCEEAFEADYTAFSQISWAPGVTWGTLGKDALSNLNQLIPGEIACPKCITCSELTTVLAPILATDVHLHPNGPDILTTFLNKEFGMNLTWWEYEEFYDECLLAPTQGCDFNTQVSDLVTLIDELIGTGELVDKGVDLKANGLSYVNSSLDVSPQAGCSTVPIWDAEPLFRREITTLPEDFIVSQSDEKIYFCAAKDPVGQSNTNQLEVVAWNMDFTFDWQLNIDASTGYFFRGGMHFQMVQKNNGNIFIAVIEQVINSSVRRLAVIEVDPIGKAVVGYHTIPVAYEVRRILGIEEEQSTGDPVVAVGFGDGEYVRWYKINLTLTPITVTSQEIESLTVGRFKGKAMIQDANGDFVTGMHDGSNLTLKWFDSNLAEINGKQLEYPFSSTDMISQYELFPKASGGLYALVRMEGINSTFYLLNLTGNGGVIWTKSFEVVGFNNGNISLIEDVNDGDIIVALAASELMVTTEPHPSSREAILRIDPTSGTVIDQVFVDGLYTSPGLILQEESNDRYLVLHGSTSDISAFQRYIIDPGNEIDATCAEGTETIIVGEHNIIPVNGPAASTIAATRNAGGNLTNPTSTQLFVPSCPELLKVDYYDGCAVDCEVELTLPAGIPGAAFANLSTAGLPQLNPDGSFSFIVEYTYQGTLYQVLATGTSSCFQPCEPELTLCNQPLIPDVPYWDNCQDHLIAMAQFDARMAYNQYKEEKLNEFKQEYLEACVNSANLAETYTMEAPFHEYHFMLYHYDQAGNLVKTVSPKGAKSATNNINYTSGGVSLQDAINDARDAGNAMVNPYFSQFSFQYFTLYEYNSLNQLIEKFSKDEGESNYWYDELGRQILAQDAEQNHVGGLYSYVSYDALGRPIESGEIDDQGQSFPAIVAKNNPTNYLTYSSYEPWVTGGLKMEYSQTHYDEEATGPVLAEFEGKQTNLRNRVAYVSYYNPDAALDYEHHTYYAYDIQGNVHTLVHEYPELAFLENQYKKITYDFDLISGNVKQVNYQPGHPDRFVHRYQYDSDNRLVAAFTSPDSVFFDRDATYEYYLHGPLARVNLGEWDVQGVDYAYTIHGWLKGVNAETLDPTRDIGLDGIAGSTHASVARDAFGFALHYYQGDYTGIKTTPGAIDHFLTDDNAFFSFTNSGYDAPRSLYNGNIMMMQTALMDGANASLPEQRMKYEYDQLHRIIAANAFRHTNLLSTNQWDLSAGHISNIYKALYTYDENGNLKTLNRHGSTASSYYLRDRFTYIYNNNQSNQLNHVIDIKGSTGPQDMDTQAQDNYEYYEDGNLKLDVLDNIAQIHWNVANKIDRIEFTSGATGKPEEIQFRYDAMGERIVKLVKPDASDQNSWVYTYYVRDAQGNVMAIYKRQTIKPSETTAPPGTDISSAWSTFSSAEYFRLSEQHLYGSSRLGVLQTELALAIYTSEATPGLITNLPYWYSPFAPLPGDPCGCAPCANPPCDPCWCITPGCAGGLPCSGSGCPTSPDCYGENWPTVTTPEADHSIGVYTRGRKRYELSNHLGNVLAVISDRKLQIDGSVGSYNPDIWAYHDYYPFGMTLPDRTWQAEGYRYGFQGQEGDDEVFGEDIAINYTFRMHDARIGRFLSIDPLAVKYPFYSPYAFSGNRVIDMVELEGLEPAYTGEGKDPDARPASQKEMNTKGFGWIKVQYITGLQSKQKQISAIRELNKRFPKHPISIPEVRFLPSEIKEGVRSVTGGNDMQEAVGVVIKTAAIQSIQIAPGLGTLKAIVTLVNIAQEYSEEEEEEEEVKVLYHYTTSANLQKILNPLEYKIRAGANDHAGTGGVYLTDIPPEKISKMYYKSSLTEEDKKMGRYSKYQAIHILWDGRPWRGDKKLKIQNYIEVNVSGEEVIYIKPHHFSTTQPILNLINPGSGEDRVLDAGLTDFRK